MTTRDDSKGFYELTKLMNERRADKAAAAEKNMKKAKENNKRVALTF